MTRVVLDANIAVALVVSLPYSTLAQSKVDSWLGARTELYAPTLWAYEITNGLRKFIVRKQITRAGALEGLRRIEDLHVELLPLSGSLQEQALVWAERLGHIVAYDATYLAAAAYLEAEFWTADRALYNNARQHGAFWTHWLGEGLESE